MSGWDKLSWATLTVGLLSATLCVYYLPVEDWDEARRGINAVAMNCRGDYLNYYYLDAPDTFNTKPPLFLWLVAGLYGWLGAGIVALRLPSLVALAVFLVYVYRWSRCRFGGELTFILLAALVSVNGIIGYHVGISGDTDMLFTLLLTVFGLELYGYLKAGTRGQLLRAVAALCLAVLTKGVAVGLVLPGALVGSLLHPKLRSRVTLRNLLPTGLLLLAGLSATAYLLAHMGRATLPQAGYANLLEATFLRDGLQRLSDPGFEPEQHPFYVFEVLDTRFGLLIYGLYLMGIVALLRFGVSGLWRRLRRDGFALYALSIVLSVLGLLQWSESKHDWYVAPAVVYLSYLFARGFPLVVRDPSIRLSIMIALLGWATYSRSAEIYDAIQQSRTLPEMVVQRIENAKRVYVAEQSPQSTVYRITLAAGSGCKVGLLPGGYGGGDCEELDGGARVCYE